MRGERLTALQETDVVVEDHRSVASANVGESINLGTGFEPALFVENAREILFVVNGDIEASETRKPARSIQSVLNRSSTSRA